MRELRPKESTKAIAKGVKGVGAVASPTDPGSFPFSFTPGGPRAALSVCADFHLARCLPIVCNRPMSAPLGIEGRYCHTSTRRHLQHLCPGHWVVRTPPAGLVSSGGLIAGAKAILCLLLAFNAQLVAQSNQAQPFFEQVLALDLGAGLLQAQPSQSGELDPATSNLVNTIALKCRQLTAQIHSTNATELAPVPTLGQAAAYAALARKLNAKIEVRLRPENGTVAQLKMSVGAGRPLKTMTVGRREFELQATRAFLRAARVLLKLQNPDTELKLRSWEPGGAETSTLKFDQLFQGYRVWPMGLAVEVRPDGSVVSLHGAYVPTPLGLVAVPHLDASQALAAAKTAVGSKEAEVTDQPEPVVFSELAGPPVLAWRIGLALPGGAWWVVVSDTDGQILHLSSRVMTENVPGRGTDLLGIQRPLNVWRANGQYHMIDASKLSYQSGKDPLSSDTPGVIQVSDAQGYPLADVANHLRYVTSASPSSWTLPAAVSAAFNFSSTFDYFSQVFGRNSLDGQGGRIVAVVEVAWDNACWNSALQTMFFGNASAFVGSIDVVAHELTHGVTSHTADLVYRDQSGALNEAISDAFGEFVEGSVKGQLDWKVGSDLGEALRDLANPSPRYPSKMSEYLVTTQDNGGVHYNSTIIGHAFYRLTSDLGNQGKESDAEQIIYRCLTRYLNSSSQFVDARLGCVAAAEELFRVGSTQATAVGKAFDAVEVYDLPGTAEPSRLPPVDAPDSGLYIDQALFNSDWRLGRLEAAMQDGGGRTLVNKIALERPSVLGDGSVVIIIGADHDLYSFETGKLGSLESGGASGLFHSAAFSPEGTRLAFVIRDKNSGQPLNKIAIVLNPQTTREYGLVVPTTEGGTVENVRYADALSFCADGSALLYDAVSRLRHPDGSIEDLWSLYAIDIATGTTFVLVPPIPALDVGNPAFGLVSDRYIVFEARSTATLDGGVFVGDLFTGQTGQITSYNGGFAYPAFSGDERAVVYAYPDDNLFSATGYSIAWQPLTDSMLDPQGSPSQWISDARLAVVYRRGTFRGTNKPPTVTLAAPGSGASAPAPAIFQVAANATDSDGIAKVEFYNGSSRIGTATIPPYAFNWSAPAPGSYRLLARAYDRLGAAADSESVVVTVTSSSQQPVLGISILPSSKVRLAVKAPMGSYSIERSPNMRSWQKQGTLTVGSSGSATVDIAVDGSLMFYRVKRD